MCLTNITKTERIKCSNGRKAYKVVWYAGGGKYYTGPFSPQLVFRDGWMCAESAIDVDPDIVCEWVPEYNNDGSSIPQYQRNPSSHLRGAFAKYDKPAFHCFWRQQDAGKYLASVIDYFGHEYSASSMCERLRIEQVLVAGRAVDTGEIEKWVPGGGLVACRATHIKFREAL